jgi:hypothetical protein
MLKCSLCGKQTTDPRQWVCGSCALEHALPLNPADWPAWAQSQRQREATRRRFEPGYGVSNELTYAPYSRRQDNICYRSANRVHKPAGTSPARTDADNLLYSTLRGGDASHDYSQVLESMPVELRDQLLQESEHRTILADAIRSLPVVSQRAVLGTLVGRSVEELAEIEGLAKATMRWLLTSAMDHLRDLLTEKLGADDGSRYR